MSSRVLPHCRGYRQRILSPADRAWIILCSTVNDNWGRSCQILFFFFSNKNVFMKTAENIWPHLRFCFCFCFCFFCVFVFVFWWGGRSRFFRGKCVVFLIFDRFCVHVAGISKPRINIQMEAAIHLELLFPYLRVLVIFDFFKKKKKISSDQDCISHFSRTILSYRITILLSANQKFFRKNFFSFTETFKYSFLENVLFESISCEIFRRMFF